MLLKAVLAARNDEATKTGRRVPVFLKIAPDLTEEGIDDIAAEVIAQRLDGVIVSNTTLSRDGLSDRTHAKEAAGSPASRSLPAPPRCSPACASCSGRRR